MKSEKNSFLKLIGVATIILLVISAAFAADKEKTIIKIGYLPLTDHLTIIAKEQEKFSNIELVPVKFSSWAEISEAVKANAIDGAFLLTPIGINLRGKGVPVKAVLLGHRNGSVITAKNNDSIKSIEDLKSKTIAIPSRFSTHNILLRKELGEKGISTADVKIIEMAPPEMVNALSLGKIDAFMVAEPFGGQAEFQKTGKILMLSKDIWPNHICCVLNINESLIEKKPEAVQELVSAFVNTSKFIESDPAGAAKTSKKFLGQKPEVIKHVLTTPKGRIVYDDLNIDLSDFEQTQNYMLKYDIVKEKIDLTQYIDNRFTEKAYSKQ